MPSLRAVARSVFRAWVADAATGVPLRMRLCNRLPGRCARRDQRLAPAFSFKVRNPANAADNWELAVLKQFEARKTQGEPADKLEFFDVIDDDQGKKTFRYMKAIPTGALCLNCHGEHIPPEVDAKLKELYPNDQARGFKEGDLRGAFTLAKPVQ